MSENSQRRLQNLSVDGQRVASRLGDALSDRGEIGFAYVHGSFAEGLPYRDIDVAVFLHREDSVLDEFDYAADLSVYLSRLVAHVVDVQVLNSAPVGFRVAVLQGMPILVRDDVALADYIERVVTEYTDFAELGRSHLREVLAP